MCFDTGWSSSLRIISEMISKSYNPTSVYFDFDRDKGSFNVVNSEINPETFLRVDDLLIRSVT